MIIYLIRNKIDGKCYVGQTIHDFKRRYDKSGNWWNSRTANRYLKNAAQKYGVENFEVRILEKDVKTEEELNLLERQYIRLYTAIYPMGYNYQAGGQLTKNRGHHEITVKRLSAHGASQGGPIRLLNNTETKIYEFTNIARFAKQMGLQRSLIFNMLWHNKKARHLRWSQVKHPIKRFVVRHEDGRELEIFDGEIKAFCRKEKIAASGRFFKMLNGELFDCKKWKLIRAYTPSLKGVEVIKLKQYDLSD